MKDKNLAFSAMLLSVGLFVVVGFTEYYPIFGLHGQHSNLLDLLHGFFQGFKELHQPLLSRGFLVMGILGSVMLYNPRKKEGKTSSMGMLYFVLGTGLLLLTGYFPPISMSMLVPSMLLYLLGFAFSVNGAVHLFQVMDFTDIREKDPFNNENETFRQTEQCIETKHSVNIPYEYQFKGKPRKGWINFVNLFRALLIIGTPGSGKSFALIEEIIEQLIEKNFTLLIYDFKFDTLSKITYNYWRRKKERMARDTTGTAPKLPKFYTISFDNIEKSHRCNPIDPYLMRNQSDAADAATIIMKNLNRDWIKRGDFFSKSAISFVSGLIWYLKKKSEETGQNICTLPHVIALSTVNIEYLLEIMLQDMEVRSLMVPFKDAMERQAGQQLAGQTASAQISLSLLANKEIFYIMTGNDFRLDLNNPEQPKILCIQNNPDRSEIYAAPIGLYLNKTLQVVNRPGCRPLGLILDELPTVFIMGLRKIIDTGRSHYVATVLGIQSITQLIADYGRELAEVIFDNCSNVFSGAAKGETARRMSEIFGRIHQDKKSKAISNNDATINFSTILSELLPKSKITSMSTGHFAGVVADTFENPIKQKLCFGLIKPNMASKKIQGKYELPKNRQFKGEGHEEELTKKIRQMASLEFISKLEQLDFGQQDYLTFYNGYIIEFAMEHYPNAIRRKQFVRLIRELQLFDHLPHLAKLTRHRHDSHKSLKMYLIQVMDRMLIKREIDKVLEDNFMQVFTDIEKMVTKEYYVGTGTYPELALFDKKKLEEIEEAPKEPNEDEYAASIVQDFKKRISRKYGKAFLRQQGAHHFEDIRPVATAESHEKEQNPDTGGTLFCSYPMEELKENNKTKETH